MENQGYSTTTQPELHEKKPGIADKVKGLLGGHKQHAADTHDHTTTPVYGDATPATGTAESTRVGCLDKLKAKTGVGHGLAPAQTRAQGGGLHHHEDPSASPDFNGGTNVNSSAAVHGGWPHPTNPNEGLAHHHRETHNQPTGLANPFANADHYNQATGTYGTNPDEGLAHHQHRETHNQPTGLANPFANADHYHQATGTYGAQAPTEVTNPQGGAVLGDHQGNVYEGPRDDAEKKEGFVSKIMDKLHSPKGKSAGHDHMPY